MGSICIVCILMDCNQAWLCQLGRALFTLPTIEPFYTTSDACMTQRPLCVVLSRGMLHIKAHTASFHRAQLLASCACFKLLGRQLGFLFFCQWQQQLEPICVYPI